jgi:peptidoglycan hydrolase-like protein with peptidoglycan-binding domain
MKKITTTGVAIFAVISFALATHAFAYSTIDTALDLGERNNDVTNLQAFFKDNSSIYPEGLVTGYFGAMSRSAVQRFQTSKGIVSSGSAATTGFGRVGPSTRDAINALINSGGWSGGVSVSIDISGPAFQYVTRNVTQNTATFVWNTNEMATGKVFYNTSPIYMNEGDINSVGFGSTNGYVMLNDNLSRTSQQVTLTNLQPNTRYWYVIVSTDLKGNVSVFDPNQTFVTNQ